jgi:hypothetical protein
MKSLKRLFGHLWLVVLVLGSPAAAHKNHGQKDNAQTPSPARPSSCRVPIVSIDAQVISATTGTPVSDLRREDFIISENYVRQQVFSFQRLRAPLTLTIIVEAVAGESNALALGTQVDAIRLALAGCLEAGDLVCVMVVAERPLMLLGFTNSREYVNEALDQAVQRRVESESPVDGKLSMALQEAEEKASGLRNDDARNVIILLSDMPGRRVDKVILPPAVVRMMVGSATVLCSSGAGPVTHHFFKVGTDSLENATIADMVGLTGGSFVTGGWKSCIERLRPIYRITYLPFSEGRQGELVKMKLEIKPNLEHDAHNLRLIYPQFAVLPDC